MTTTAALNGEPLLPLSQAARLVPGHRGADELSPGTVGRWIAKGMPVPGGGRVRLEGVRVGHRWLTSAAALARFAAAADTPSPIPSPTARRRAADRAAEVLKAAGA